ncbi:hypothetical protein [Peribacillus tepidiphilus]|uniref:hypothetical protein n=1 Tax=Peribacillus tepidiphilus TaxID=2652445 RepID=UPI001290F3D0|nr:hypothetical protein [Peribacillus tepidiphilus]
MEELLMVFISVLILIPVMYIVPLGLSFKGKIVLMTCSFFVSVVLIFSKAIIQMWQLILLAVALLLLFSIFLNKKFLIFEKNIQTDSLNDSYKNDSGSSENDRLINRNQSKEDSVVNIDTDKKEFASSEGNKEDHLLLENEKDHLLVDQTPQPDNDYIEPFEPLINFEQAMGKSSEASELNQSEEMSLVHSFIETIEPNKEHLELQPLEEISEINHATETSETSKNQDHDYIQAELEELDFLSERSILLDEMNEETNSSSEKDHLNYMSEIESILNDDEFVSSDLEEISSSAPITFEEKDERTLEMIEGAVEHQEEDFISNPFNSQTAVNDLQSLNEPEDSFKEYLLEIMLSQVKQKQKSMTPKEYEQLIKDHLTEDLPDQTYFLFARELIDHFIRQRDLFKLEALLLTLMEKYKKYPILFIQLEYLYNHYVLKQTS